MSATYTIFVLLTLTVFSKCNNGTTSTTVATTTSTTVGTTTSPTPGTTADLTTTTLEPEPEPTYSGIRGLYGGTYYNYDLKNPNNTHYIHGTYQSPSRDYYKIRSYFRDEGSDETLDYYLGFGISKMTDENFEYQDFHHQYHDLNRNISDNDTIRSDWVITCHPNATYLCPENTETVCLMNGTIYCMSKMSVVEPCPQDEEFTCVNSTLPCVRACIALSNDFEEVHLPCLATIFIVDVYEIGGGMTISTVGNGFVLMPALTKEERTFCVTVVVDPKPKPNEN